MFCIVALVVAVAFAQPHTASADMGPKPSINVKFENVSDRLCYATILSKYNSTGPYSAYDPDSGLDYRNFGAYDSNYYYDENYHNEEVERTWQAFVDYKDADGYYFLQLWWKVDGENNQIRWGYYPPYSFKLLLYYPDSNMFVTSLVYERYAFDSYYTVDLTNANVQLNPDTSAGSSNPGSSQGEVLIELEMSYDYFGEIVGLLCRIALTILIELLIALIFRMKGRKVMLTILAVNVVTQIALNVALNLIYYLNGVLVYLLFFILLEIAVVIVEAVAYSLLLRKHGVPIWKSLIYALVANAVTAVAGFFLAHILPGMF